MIFFCLLFSYQIIYRSSELEYRENKLSHDLELLDLYLGLCNTPNLQISNRGNHMICPMVSFDFLTFISRTIKSLYARARLIIWIPVYERYKDHLAVWNTVINRQYKPIRKDSVKYWQWATLRTISFAFPPNFEKLHLKNGLSFKISPGSNN